MKTGYLTTEFWMTIISIVLGSLVAFGVITAEDGEQLEGATYALIAAMLNIAAYAISRGWVKSNA